MFKILLVGAGPMGREYIRVIKELQKLYKIELICACRSEKSKKEIMLSYDIEAYTSEIPTLINTLGKFDLCIIATNIESLFAVTKTVINNKAAKKILVEKPVSFKRAELKLLKDAPNIFVAYNRRFYSSIRSLKTMTHDFSDVSSIHFDFTELVHRLKDQEISEVIRRNWLIANSSHVIDLVSYISGPVDLEKSYFGVKGELDWNGGPINFFGMGLTSRDIPFTYNSDWDSAGRWGIQVKSSSYNYLLQPMEELKYNRRGSFDTQVKKNCPEDESFKPGLYHQVAAFLDQNYTNLCSIQQHYQNFKVFSCIINGTQ
tara:strand:+ start:15802 stop:16749 length:948 start_codon:yes stop_codon:yes gene_type:complete